jgi:hypothetical protein
MPSTNRANDGRAFEERIQTTLTHYAGIMRVKKVDPPSRVMGGGAARRVIFLENPFLDFGGAWTARGGRAIFFEAKSTKDHKLRFDQSGGLTTKQLDAVRHWHNAGAVTFALWEWKDVGVKLLPGWFLADLRDRARAGYEWKHVLWAQSDLVVSQGAGYRLVDFLPVIEKLWPKE